MRNHPARKPTRAPGFDYHNQGPYFVTICVEHRSCLFGHIHAGEMHLNAAGCMIDHAWSELETKFPTVELLAHVVMPNHLHALITLRGSQFDHYADDGVVTEPALSDIVGWFKTMTTNWYMHGVRNQGWTSFDGKLWQRSFHDRIVRNDAEMGRIQSYVANNPAFWLEDTFYSD